MNETQFASFLDATFLKRPSDFSDVVAYRSAFTIFLKESKQASVKAVVVYPNELTTTIKYFSKDTNRPIFATVIDFPLGNSSTQDKLNACREAFSLGAEEVDVVCNYHLLHEGETAAFYSDFFQVIDLVHAAGKTSKIILETAAIDPATLIKVVSKIKQYCVDRFHENDLHRIFLKTSTGFYQAAATVSTGATRETAAILLENGFPLPVKASGGIRTFEQAHQYIKMGVKRIGTSAALQLVNQEKITSDY